MKANTRRSRQVASEVSRLYEDYAPQLRFFLRRQLRVKHKVEDLLHEVFECLLRYPPTETLVRPDNYLWRIAWRMVNASNRRVQRDCERMAEIAGTTADWVMGQSSPPTPEDMAEWLAYQEHVRQGLEQLTPEERKAVILARLGYPYNEIAARMNLSVDALRTHLRRGYLVLKSYVRAVEEE